MVCYLAACLPNPPGFTSPTSGPRPSGTSVSPSKAPGWSRSSPSSRPSSAGIGLTRVRPRFYLSTEWGVPFETVAIAIPFYLARPDLTALHAERVGHVEGFDRADILRYLRHEMGHVVNYAYRLYDEEEWVKQFGSITQPYVEEYRPEPFSRRYVRHLPGWYAQKHPDEDWSETFAVWMTPGLDWRKEYGGWPVAAAKLAYCERRHGRDPGPRSGRDRRRPGRGRGRDRVLAGPVLSRRRPPRPRELPPGSGRGAAGDLRGPGQRRRACRSTSRWRPRRR